MAEKKVLKGYFQRVCFLKHTILKSFWKDRIPPYQLKVSRLGGMRVGFSCPSLLQVPVCKPVPSVGDTEETISCEKVLKLCQALGIHFRNKLISKTSPSP